ncbi:cache domain-containing protein [Desulfopila aestuarii]|uniref:Cache domain-containing protein n=1 Tax=Desulfopila aestuarii DSM 18488 TaxID=1121416 RepID=A0A1M7YJ90_9BACT|nr:cache domain-containing protein [Desulfopila aestuarii]SHO52697.1 hypothetical protein SAMN02745220_04691 [Desulfopila aestuarii DSM 18488]
MKKLISIILVGFICVLGSSVVFAEEAPQAVKDLAATKLAAYGSDPVIVAAVKEQNAMGKSLDDIKAMDKKWQETAGVDSYMKSLMESACGKHLGEILGSQAYFAEIFVMDNQGANVAMTGKTSDYWQGDEAKFAKSFADGAGAVFVDEVEFDDSSQAYLVQVSVPVMEAGKAIGAITFGIDVEKVE